VSQAAFFIEVDELDQKKGSNSEELKKMGWKKQKKTFSMGQLTSFNSNIGSSFANFITPIADLSELHDLELENRKTQRKKVMICTRKTSSLKEGKHTKGNTKL
jgi:hypothetical protein